MFDLNACLYALSMSGVLIDQKRASDALELKLHTCQSLCGRWEKNLDPPENQPVLLITKSFPQPLTLNS